VLAREIGMLEIQGFPLTSQLRLADLVIDGDTSSHLVQALMRPTDQLLLESNTLMQPASSTAYDAPSCAV